MKKTYSNKYGTVTIETVADFAPVSGQRLADQPAAAVLEIEDVEKIALISGNAGLQPVYSIRLKKWGILLHVAPKYAAFCKIVELQFTAGVNPAEEIARLTPNSFYF